MRTGHPPNKEAQGNQRSRVKREHKTNTISTTANVLKKLWSPASRANLRLARQAAEYQSTNSTMMKMHDRNIKHDIVKDASSVLNDARAPHACRDTTERDGCRSTVAILRTRISCSGTWDPACLRAATPAPTATPPPL